MLQDQVSSFLGTTAFQLKFPGTVFKKAFFCLPYYLVPATRSNKGNLSSLMNENESKKINKHESNQEILYAEFTLENFCQDSVEILQIVNDRYPSSMPFSTHLKNYSAVAFTIVNLDLAT